MAYRFSLYRRDGGAITPVELRGAVVDLPFFHPHGPDSYVCDVPRRNLWMELSPEQDGSISVHVPQRAYHANSATVHEVCLTLAAQLSAAVFDHQLERDLLPGAPGTGSDLPQPDGLPGEAPIWLRPLDLTITALGVALLLGLLALIALLAGGILAVQQGR